MTHEAQQIAQGDLRASDLKVKNRDEIGQLAASFNLMNHNLKQVVLGLASSSDSLSEASQQLSAAINETKEAANQISVSIQGTAANNDTQARSIREISRAMEEMTDGIQRIAATSSTAYEASAGTLDEAERGNELILLATEQMNAVSVTVGDLRTVIDKLGERSQQIGEIVQVITEISAQTHLLALNASIEAAQAGEHGKGFAVVASEIRKLAERSNQSAEQVAGLIEAIQTDIGNTIKTMHKGEEEVEAGVNGIHETGKALVRILNATRSVVDQVQEASAAAEEMSASSQQIAASLLEMERVSTQTANAAQEITAATEEQLASMEEIASSADTLSQMSEEMKQVVYKFKI
jgi:methyl-accepting chemotaxis protein